MENRFWFSCTEKNEIWFFAFAKSQNLFSDHLIFCFGDLFITTDAYIIEISQVDGQLQSAGTWLLNQSQIIFPLAMDNPIQKCANMFYMWLVMGASCGDSIQWNCVMLKINKYSSELVLLMKYLNFRMPRNMHNWNQSYVELKLELREKI